MDELIKVMKKNNQWLKKNTFYTGAGAFVGLVALIISLIALTQ